MNGKNRDRIRPVGLNRFPKYIDGGVQRAMAKYFDLLAAEGSDPMDQDWDQLLILDGCRYDMFRRYNTLEGELQKWTSKATATPEFLSNTFDGRIYPETVYVTANPIHRVEAWTDIDLDSVFYEVVDVWEQEWDDNLGTVPPEAMVGAVRRARKNHPDCRIVAHFVQPHYPFIGPFGRSLDHGKINGKQRAEGAGSNTDEKPIWERLRDGEKKVESVWKAYNENLWYVLPYVHDLVADLTGKTVVTSDHGNHVGELAWPFPVRMYGHPVGIKTPELVTVPWLLVRNSANGQTKTDTGNNRGGDVIASAGQSCNSSASSAGDGPLVSVVIPTHYRNEKLTHTLESVRDQHHEPVEIIVVDDSGTAFAQPVADKDGINYFAHEKKRGANQARNTGIEAAQGKYIQLLDDDDSLHPKKISRQIELLEENPDVGVVFCGLASETGLRIPTPSATGKVLEETLQFGPKACTTSAMLISASLLKNISPLPDRDGADDIGIRIELAMQTEFDHVPEALVYKGGQELTRADRPAVGYELLKIVNEYEELYAEYEPSLRQTALKKAYATLGENTLNTDGWSLRAPIAFIQALRYEDNRTVADCIRPAIALFGSTGFHLASSLYNFFMKNRVNQ